MRLIGLSRYHGDVTGEHRRQYSELGLRGDVPRERTGFLVGIAEGLVEDIVDRSIRVKRYLPHRVLREQLTNDEFKHAVAELKAGPAIVAALNKQVGAIWTRTAQARSQAADGLGLLAFMMFFLIVGVILAFNAGQDWLSANWPTADQSLGNALDQLIQSALADWRAIGDPDRWVYLAGTLALSIIAKQIVVEAVLFVPLVIKDLQRSVEDEVVPIIRIALNDIANRRYRFTLPVTSAPGLGEVSSPHRLVIREELERIRIWSEELGAPAIAISGSRGVGKTTLLKSLVEPSYKTRTKSELDVLPIFVAAPVTYDAREFLILLYSELCREVLRVTGRHRASRTPLVVRRLTRRILRSIRVVLGLGLLIVTALAFAPLLNSDVEEWMKSRSWPVLDSLWAAGFLAAATLLIWVVTKRILPVATGIFYAPSPIAQEAESQLRQLRYLQTFSTESSGGIKKLGLELGRKRSKQLAERSSTLPELVASYRDFAATVGRWFNSSHGGRLLICIDEVDRISRAEQAEAFINEIKAIFGIKYCRYLVTVSEDALAGFERRVIGVRPTLDSAFDEVLRLEPFTARQSLDLLRRHVVGFPDVFIVLCHCLGGGLPRDIVREARALLDENRGLARTDDAREWTSANSATNIRRLTASITEREIQALKRGLINRIRNLENADQLYGVQSLLADRDWPGSSTDSVLRALADLVTMNDDEQNELRREVASAVYFYVTVRDVFTEKLEIIGNWEGDSGDELSDVVDDLARVRSLLTLSPIVASRALSRIRKCLDLPLLVIPGVSGERD